MPFPTKAVPRSHPVHATSQPEPAANPSDLPSTAPDRPRSAPPTREGGPSGRYSRCLPETTRGWPMKPYALGRGEGEAIWMFDSLDTIKADVEHTRGGFTVVEFLDFEGSSVPLHVNDSWDTGFYVLDGEYTFAIEDDMVAASSGAWLFVP